MTDKQKHTLRLCVGFMLACIHRNENISIGWLLDTMTLAKEKIDFVPCLHITKKELEELLPLLEGEEDDY